MATVSLNLKQFKASGIYTLELDASQTVVLNTQTIRLVVGFSKVGPINAPVYCSSPKIAQQVFGPIDTNLENKGSFFHRSLQTCLQTGPCFALNLVTTNDDITSSAADLDTYKSFSLSTTETNGITSSVLYSSFFNKQRFWIPDTNYFLGNVSNSIKNSGKLLNFTNLGQTPFSVFVYKSGSVQGFNVTARDWYGVGNVPSFINDFDFISDYFVNVDVVLGDWTNYSSLSVDPIFYKYFNSQGVIISNYSNFLADNNVTRIASFQGSVIPDLIDNNKTDYSIDTIVNNSLASTGLFCALDRAALADYNVSDVNSPGRVDMIGDTLIGSSATSVNFLSYNFTCVDSTDYQEVSFASKVGEIQLGTAANGEYPGGIGITGAGYTAGANGYLDNDPARAAYFTSYYGSGNQGIFSNVLNLRKEAFSAIQYGELSSLVPGKSAILIGNDAFGTYATIDSVNEQTVINNGNQSTVLSIAISHPAKTNEFNLPAETITLVGTDYFNTGSSAAVNNVKVGDWIAIYTYNSTVTPYLLRVIDKDGDASTSWIRVDITNSQFGGAAIMAALGSISPANIYMTFNNSEGPGSVSAGSFCDILDINGTQNTFNYIVNVDRFNYNSVSGNQSYYIGYPGSLAYEAFEKGLIYNGNEIYVSGNSNPLYLSGSYSSDSDSIPVINLYAYLDSSLTVGYTGSWSFMEITTSTGQTANGLEIYSLSNDYIHTLGATGFNSTYTSFYVSASDAQNIQVNQYVVADPNNTGNVSNYLLTRVLSKTLITSGTFKGYYQIKTNQRIAKYADYTQVVRYKAIQDVANNYQPTYLAGHAIQAANIPDGSDTTLAYILSMLDPAVSNLYNALSSRHIIAFRYIIDTFDGGIGPNSAPKNLITALAKNRQKCLAIMNAPSITKMIKSRNPYFSDAPTQANPVPLFDTSFVATGGNLQLGPSNVYSLPNESNGSQYSGFFAPFLTITDTNGKKKNIPPAADVSNNFVLKFINGQPYSIVAGQRRGVLNNSALTGLEYDFTDEDRANIEPFGWNPIVYRKGVGYMIYGNQTAYQNVLSAFNDLHVRDLLVTIETDIEDILSNFLFEFNDASTRLQISNLVNSYLDIVRSGGGIYTYSVTMDTSNNTPAIIDQNYGVIDIEVEIARGMQKFINTIKVQKTGGISSGGFATK